NLRKYRSFYRRFNNALRSNLKFKKTRTVESYYSWNSTFDEPYTRGTKQLKSKNQYKNSIQDVAHGNSIIQYVISSYELGLNDWTRTDIRRFSNTLKFSIWNGAKGEFADNVEGTKSEAASIRGTGWYQSDGWMKLARY